MSRFLSTGGMPGPRGMPGLGGFWVKGPVGGSGPSMPSMFPGPHARGKFRGIWPGGVSRPTPKREVQGDLVQAHTQAHTPMTATAVDSTHPTGMRSCLAKHLYESEENWTAYQLIYWFSGWCTPSAVGAPWEILDLKLMGISFLTGN